MENGKFVNIWKVKFDKKNDVQLMIVYDKFGDVHIDTIPDYQDFRENEEG
jgi:hypothetical protein